MYYADDPRLKGFVPNLWEGLQGQAPPSAVRIQSPQGWGKTSCFYFLRYVLSGNDKLRYHLHIIHMNKFVSARGVDGPAVVDRCVAALREYINTCGPDAAYARDVCANPELGEQQKLNELIEHIKTMRSSFSKRLVVIIDDADMFSNERHVVDAAVEVFRRLQPITIIKWLAIRDATIQGYTPRSRQTIDTLYPAVHDFPSISLYDIVTHRIRTVAEEGGVNPFSERLCQHLQDIYDGDHRTGLATLEQVLRECDPGNISAAEAKQEFLQRYLERETLRTLMNRRAVPNIFVPVGRMGTFVPLARDVLLLIYSMRTIDDDFIRLINESIKDRMGALTRKQVNVSVTFRDLREVTSAIEDMGLIEMADEHHVRLIRPTGRILQPYLDQEHYIDLCRVVLGDQQPEEIFWRQAYTASDLRARVVESIFGISLG